MRTLLVVVFVFGLIPRATSEELKTATLYADKIYCEACAAVITKALRDVLGVGKVSVDVARKEVRVQFDPAKATLENLTAATAKRGFPATVRKVEP